MLIALGDSHRHTGVLAGMAQVLVREQPQVFVHTGDNYGDFLYLRRESKIPGHGVRGNCDPLLTLGAPEEVVFDYEGFKIFLTHGHKYGAKHSLDQLAARAQDLGAAAVIFGHSHVQLIEERQGILFINPGSLSLPRGGSPAGYARLSAAGPKLSGQLVTI